MRVICRQWSVVAATLVIIGIFLYLSSARFNPEQGRQLIDVALFQELLHSSQQSSAYRLLPESVMTGFCWHTEDGVKEGVFKDMYAGIAHWRNQASSVPATGPVSNNPAVSTTANGIDFGQLVEELEQLSFEATGYRHAEQTAEITGILSIADTRRRVVLKANLPELESGETQQDLIELNASTVLASDDFANVLAVSNNNELNLCLSMQAARITVLPEPSSDQPFMLSHYY